MPDNTAAEKALRSARRRRRRVRESNPFDAADQSMRLEREQARGRAMKRLGRTLGPKPVSPKKLKVLIDAELDRT